MSEIDQRNFNIIILAAGLGWRLRPETDYIPKALVKIGKQRGIDYLIKKYQHMADKIVIAVGYRANLLKQYVRKNYPSLNIAFSQEDETELRGPGKSLVYALDLASSRSPTLVTFCDYIMADNIHIDTDALGVCQPLTEARAVLDTYKTIAVIDRDIVIDVIKNDNLNVVKHGFTGIAVCRNTLLLKSIAYNAACELGINNIEYTLDIIQPYISKTSATALYLSKIFEFGTKDTLKMTRIYANNQLLM